VPHHVRSSWSTTNHNKSDFLSDPLVEGNTSYSHQHDCPPESLTIGGGQNVYSSYWTPESTSHSFPDYDISFNQYEILQEHLDGATDDSLSHWPVLDNTMSPLTELLNNHQTVIGLSRIDDVPVITASATQMSNYPFLAELGTPTDTNFPPEYSSMKSLSQSVEQSSNSSTATLSPGTPISKSKSTKSTSSKGGQVDNSRIQKRTLNTLAARRYRQKRLDQMSELEGVLKETQAERDALKVRVARLEGEVDVLRGLLQR